MALGWMGEYLCLHLGHVLGNGSIKEPWNSKPKFCLLHSFYWTWFMLTSTELHRRIKTLYLGTLQALETARPAFACHSSAFINWSGASYFIFLIPRSFKVENDNYLTTYLWGLKIKCSESLHINPQLVCFSFFTMLTVPPAVPQWLPTHLQAILFPTPSIFSLLMEKLNYLNKW